MEIKWVSEEKVPAYNSNHFKSTDDFLTLLENKDIEKFSIPESIKAVFNTSEIPTELSKDIIQDLDTVELMDLTIVCANKLFHAPTLDMWKKIQLFRYNSWHVQHWFSNAISALIIKNDDAGFLITLMPELWKNLDENKLSPLWKRIKDNRKNALLAWGQSLKKLDDLWWGLRVSGDLDYDNELVLLGLLNEYHSDVCKNLISTATNPFLIDEALLYIGAGVVSGNFKEWKTSVQIAPAAFNKDSSWSESAVLPLLLVNATSQLNEAGRQLRHDSAEHDINLNNEATKRIVKEIIDILSIREDAPGVFSRWTAWLMRQLVTQNGEFNDARSSNYINELLLTEIGEKIKEKVIKINLPDDAEPWEHWCYLCVQGYWMQQEFIERECNEAFDSLWDITPDNWPSTEGENLRSFSQLHIPTQPIPNYSSYLLAEQLTSSSNNIAASWQKLWDSSYTLREIIEFGIEGDNGKNDFNSQFRASDLQLLLVSIGLACFDKNNNNNPKATELFNLLVSATLEMSYIDHTINEVKWDLLLQQLALRRAFLDSRYNKETDICLFNSENFHLRNFLKHLNTDSTELIKFLHIYLLNDWDIDNLKEDLASMSIDLSKLEKTAEKLHKVRPQKYPLDKKGINLINEKLIKNSA